MIKKVNYIFPLINAVLEKKQEGRIYKNKKTGLNLIVHKSAFAFLITKPKSNYQSILNFFIEDYSIPVYFHLYDPPDDLIASIKNDNRFDYKVRKRVQLRYLENEIINKNIISIDCHSEIINRKNFNSLNIFNLDIGNKFWKSNNDFLRNGYGSVIFYNKSQPVSICYSCCVADNIAEIDIATLPEFQGKGFAKIVSEHFINLSINKGLMPNWDCFEDNMPSLKTALSLGFTKLREYNFLSIYNKVRTNEMD